VIPLLTRSWRPAAGGPSQRSVGSPVHNGVNIGVVLAASLRDAHIETLETLRGLGAVAAWRKLRAVEPELATNRTLLALEGAIRGVRWDTLPSVDRQELITAIAAEGNGADRTTG
jgi:DNA transformation protein